MRVFTVSDVHVDYLENKNWLLNLPEDEYVNDILILAGDLTDNLGLLKECFLNLIEKFSKVFFIPGNHELWVRKDKGLNSVKKLAMIELAARECGISMDAYHDDSLSIVPLYSWYDFSFASPCSKLLRSWMDFRKCVWPENLELYHVNDYFLEKNKEHLSTENKTVISFSHFLPRIDLMPIYIPVAFQYVYPVLGSESLEKQLRILLPDIHVYGHSHVNRDITLGGIQYINNAFGYPTEKSIAKKQLKCIYEDAKYAGR